jgi:TolB-like protein
MRREVLRVNRRVLAGILAVLATVSVLAHRHWGGSGTSGAPSVQRVVLSLAWRAVGRDVEPWSGLGLAEEVRHALEVKGFVVTQDEERSDSAGSRASLLARARRLNATHVLEGTVGRRGDRSEVGMRLVRVHDGEAVWSSTFWRGPEDLGSLPADLATVVAQVLQKEASKPARPPGSAPALRPAP